MATARKVKSTDTPAALTADQKAQLFLQFLCDREAALTNKMEAYGSLSDHYHRFKSDRAELRFIRDRFLEIFER